MTKFSSKSGWEKSAWGGDSLLYDLPTIEINSNIDIEFEDIDWTYISKKLIKTLLLDCKTHALNNLLLENSKIQEKKTYFTLRKQKQVVINKQSIINVYNKLIECNVELSNLYQKYEELISKTIIVINISENSEEEGSKKVDSRKENSGEKSYKEEHFKKECLEKLSDTLEWKHRKYSYTQSTEPSREVGIRIYEVPKGKKSKLTHREKEIVSKLKLDINLLPDIIIKQPLRNGKLIERKIVESLVGNFSIFYKKEIKNYIKPFKVVVLGDYSGSMQDIILEQISMMKILYSYLKQFSNEIDVYGHTGTANVSSETLIYSDDVCTKEDCAIFKYADKDIDLLDNIGYIPSLGENYDAIVFKYFNKIYSDSDLPILFISISDGEPAGADYGGSAACQEMKVEIEKLKRNGNPTIGIGLQRNVSHLYDYSVNINTYDSVGELLMRMVNKAILENFVI